MRIAQGNIRKFIIYTGGLSMYMFALNGFLRTPWVYQSTKYEADIFMYVFALIFVIVVYFSSEILRRVERLVLKHLI